MLLIAVDHTSQISLCFMVLSFQERARLSKQQRRTKLQQVVFGRAGLQVVANFEAQTPMVVEPMVEPPAKVDQVQRFTAEGERISACHKGKRLATRIELVEDAGRKQSEPLAKAAAWIEYVRHVCASAEGTR